MSKRTEKSIMRKHLSTMNYDHTDSCLLNEREVDRSKSRIPKNKKGYKKRKRRK